MEAFKFYAVKIQLWAVTNTIDRTMLHPELNCIPCKVGRSHWPALGGSTHHRTREWKPHNQFGTEGFASFFGLLLGLNEAQPARLRQQVSSCLSILRHHLLWHFLIYTLKPDSSWCWVCSTINVRIIIYFLPFHTLLLLIEPVGPLYLFIYLYKI